MSILSRTEKSVEDASGKELERRVAAGRRVIAQLPDAAELKPGEAPTLLAEAEKAAASVKEARGELDRRAAEKAQAKKLSDHLTIRARMREENEHPQRMVTNAALERLERLGQKVGLRLDVQRLSPSELDEILQLASRIRENPDESERARLEKLCEQSADAPNFFSERRQRVKEARALATVREEAHVSLLPRRVKYAEPGSVTLPRVVFSWLQTSKGQWAVTDIGTLAVLLSSFEEARSLVRDAVFGDDADGQRVLACKGALETLRFERGADSGLGAADTSGEIKLGRSLERLAANGFLDVRRIGRHRVEVRLGERALKLREGAD